MKIYKFCRNTGNAICIIDLGGWTPQKRCTEFITPSMLNLTQIYSIRPNMLTSPCDMTPNILASFPNMLSSTPNMLALPQTCSCHHKHAHVTPGKLTSPKTNMLRSPHERFYWAYKLHHLKLICYRY